MGVFQIVFQRRGHEIAAHIELGPAVGGPEDRVVNRDALDPVRRMYRMDIGDHARVHRESEARGCG